MLAAGRLEPDTGLPPGVPAFASQSCDTSVTPHPVGVGHCAVACAISRVARVSDIHEVDGKAAKAVRKGNRLYKGAEKRGGD